MIFKSTALRFAALKGKMRFFEEGSITPFPSSNKPGGTDVKSSCFRKDCLRLFPLVFLIDDSTFRLILPSKLFAGYILIILELMFTVASVDGVK